MDSAPISATLPPPRTRFLTCSQASETSSPADPTATVFSKLSSSSGCLSLLPTRKGPANFLDNHQGHHRNYKQVSFNPCRSARVVQTTEDSELPNQKPPKPSSALR
ncbi:unnamed protein product [Prunus armeniaca]